LDGHLLSPCHEWLGHGCAQSVSSLWVSKSNGLGERLLMGTCKTIHDEIQHFVTQQWLYVPSLPLSWPFLYEQMTVGEA
jgi:hypothetical protein